MSDIVNYGLFDTRDKIWIGNDKGPKTYADYTLARIAAQVIDAQLRQAPGRTRPKPYRDAAPRLVDEKKLKLDAETALRKLESGGL